MNTDMMSANEFDLTVEQNLREELITRVEVLEKVKKLFLIPGLEMMTTKQVAEYYEVAVEAIQKVYQRHRDEVDFDGTAVTTVSALSRHFVQLKSAKGVIEFDAGDGNIIQFPTRGSKCFSKRAILRIGMLLRDGEIAKEVRTQLLNAVGKATPQQLTQDIDEEKDLMLAYAKAGLYGSKDDLLFAAQNMFRFTNRHIAALENSIVMESNAECV